MINNRFFNDAVMDFMAEIIVAVVRECYARSKKFYDVSHEMEGCGRK